LQGGINQQIKPFQIDLPYIIGGGPHIQAWHDALDLISQRGRFRQEAVVCPQPMSIQIARLKILVIDQHELTTSSASACPSQHLA
jgi:hypothetical protein